MAILYGLISSMLSMLRKMTQWRHDRLQRRYEQLDGEFNKLERNCKAEEVRLGRAVDYRSQLELLKGYDAKEEARRLWVYMAGKLSSRKRWESRLREFSGRKLPYSLGMIDTMLAMRLFDELGGLRLRSLMDWVRETWLS